LPFLQHGLYLSSHYIIFFSSNSRIFAPMRFFAFIMALLVITLSCVPCADARELPKEKPGKETKKTQHPPTDDESCSPFCHCSCCAGFSINHRFAQTSTPVPVHSPQHNARYIGNLIWISFSVWQPPKLV
jgi:hypothetical protein